MLRQVLRSVSINREPRRISSLRPRSYAAQKRVRPLLFSNRGGGAMARHHPGRLVEGEKFVSQRLEDRLAVAAPEISPADPSAEQGIAGERQWPLPRLAHE